MKNNFIQRAITGAIFIAVLIGGIVSGPIPFTILFSLISALTIYEFGTIIGKSGEVQINKSITILAGIFLFIGFGYLGVAPGKNEILIPYLFLIIIYSSVNFISKRKIRFTTGHMQ